MELKNNAEEVLVDEAVRGVYLLVGFSTEAGIFFTQNGGSSLLLKLVRCPLEADHKGEKKVLWFLSQKSFVWVQLAFSTGSINFTAMVWQEVTLEYS